MFSWSRSLRCILIAVMMVVLSFLSLHASEAEGGDPIAVSSIPGATYRTGTWYVNDTQTVTDEVIVLSGDLIINKGGELNLKNVTLMMNCTTYNGEYEIQVYGKLNVTDGDGDPSTTNDRSNITDSPYDGDNRSIGFDFRYYFRSYSSEGFSITNSIIRECGWGSGTSQSGLFIVYTDGASVQNNTIENCHSGITLSYSDEYRIINNTIRNCYSIGIDMKNWCDYGVIANNTLTHNDLGMYVYAKYTDVRGNEVYGNGNIYTTTTSRHGMQLRMELSEVRENNIYSNGGSYSSYNIFAVSCNYLRIHHNYIGMYETKTISYSSFYIYASKNIWIDNNTINKNDGNGLHISMSTTANNYHVLDNDISQNGNMGLYIRGNDNYFTPIYVRNNRLSNNENYGIYLYESIDHHIINNTITSNIAFSDGIYARYVDGGEFSNNTIDAMADDIYVASGSGRVSCLEVTNCTFSTVGLSIYGDNSIEEYNFLHINVTDKKGVVPNANISIEDKDGTLVWSGRSDDYGEVRFIRLLDRTLIYRFGGHTETHPDPYNISCSHDGHTSYGDREPTMPKTQWIEVKFNVDLPPDAPEDLLAYSYSDDINLTWEASNSPDIDHYLIFRNDSSGDWDLLYNTTSNAATKLDTTYVDADAASNWYPYTYQVVGVDAIYQRSDPTNIVTCGDWVVTSTITISNKLITLYGSLKVIGLGDLTLRNVKLTFNNHFDNENGLIVEEGASLSLLDGDNNPATDGDRTEINSSDPDNCISMTVQGPDFVMKNSLLSDCGDDSYSGQYWTPFLATKVSDFTNIGKLGMHITGDGAAISNNSFNNCFIPVLLVGSENSTVVDNTFDGDHISIHSADGKFNIIERNLMKNNSLISIFIHDDSNDTVRHNNVTNISAPDYGIALYGEGTENITVMENEVSSCDHAIYLEYSGKDNLLLENRMMWCQEGIGLRYALHTTSLNNTILNSDDYGHYVWQSDDLIIDGDTVSGSYIGSYMRYSEDVLYINVNNSGSTDYGVYCDSMDHFTVEDSWISSLEKGFCTSYGQNVLLLNSTFNGTIGLTTSGRYGTFIGHGSIFKGTIGAMLLSQFDNQFYNCTFNGTQDDINLSRSTINLYNPIYNDSRIVLDTYSSISFYWYLDVLVNHWNGQPADNASLTINELIGTKVYEGNTGSEGWIRGLVLLQRTRYAFSNVSSSPYTLTAGLGNHTGTSILHLTGSMNTTVDLINMDPAAWDVLIDPLYPTTDSNLTLDYTYLDPEGDLENGTMFRWYVNGMYNSVYDNLTVINSTDTTKLQTWFCEVIPFDGVSYGNSVKSIPVTIQNTVPVVSGVTVRESVPLSSEDLHVDYTYFDLDGDVETRSLHRWWVNDGTGWTYSGQDSPDLLAEYTNKGETWKCVVTPGDGSSYGSPVNSTNSVVILNTPPSLDDDLISITPSEPNSVMELGVQYVYYDVDSDPEGDTRFEWFVDPEGGENYTDSGTSTRVLPSNATTKGERWFCRITPHDSTEYGVTYSSPGVLILNTAPMIQGNISIFPLNPNSLANLELDYEYYDPDGDMQTSSIYRWYVDNDGEGFVFSGITHQTVLSKYLAKGQLWYCEVTPFDGEDFGPAVASLTTTIDNSPPSGSDLWISPGNAIAGEAMFAEYTFEDNDGDTEYDPVLRWYRNDELVSRWNDDLSIPLNVTEKGEVWYYTIVLTDGQYSSGLYTSKNITVGNRIPTITSAHITPETPSTSDGLEAVHTFFDIDGDAEVSHEIQWYRNQGDGGVHFSGLDGMDLFDSLFTSLGDMWYFRIRVYDGDDHSQWYQSDTVLIVNNLPTVTNRTPAQQALSIHELESVDFSIMAEDDDGDVVSYRWYLGDELKGEDRNFSLETDHTSAGAYTVRVDISDGLQTTSITWTVWVNDINRPPTLEIGSPKIPNPEVIEGEIVEFIVLGSDPDPEDENTLFIRWFLDGLPVGTSDTKYLYQPDYHSSGNHLITVELHDGESNASYTWDVTVKDKSEKTGLNEGLFGLSWDVIALVIEIFLLVGSLTLAGWGAVMLRRKKGNVQKYLNLIEKIKNSSSTPEDKDRRYLLLKKSIKSDFSNGKIPENHFLILEAELESVLGKSRAKEIKDLNIAEDLKKKVYEALEDGFLSDDEIEGLEIEIAKSSHLSSIDKQILRDKMDEWREEGKNSDEEYYDELDETSDLDDIDDDKDLSPSDHPDEISEGPSIIEEDTLDDENDDGFVSGGPSNIELDDEMDDDDDLFEIPMNSSPDDDLDEFEEI